MAVSIGTGVAALGGGLVELAARPGSRLARWTRHGTLIGSALLGPAALTAVACGQPVGVWAAPLALAAAWALPYLARNPVLPRLTAPRPHSVLLLVLAAVLFAGGIYLSPEALPASAGEASAPSPASVVTGEAREITPSPARTDAGRLVRLREWVGPVPANWINKEHEARKVADAGLTGQFIRVAPPSLDCNCFGWVFTGGRYFLPDGDVPTIIKDNGYRPVSDPRPGDLALYADGFDDPMHAGVVVGTTREGVALVESKWGYVGARYIHPADTHLYRRYRCTYYRSPRPGHLLHGLPEGDPPSDSLPERKDR
jgi:hypothetical protein